MHCNISLPGTVQAALAPGAHNRDEEYPLDDLEKAKGEQELSGDHDSDNEAPNEEIVPTLTPPIASPRGRAHMQCTRHAGPPLTRRLPTNRSEEAKRAFCC